MIFHLRSKNSPMASRNSFLPSLLLLFFLTRSYNALSFADNYESSTSLSRSQEAASFEPSLVLQACFKSSKYDACTARINIECQRNGTPTGPVSVLHSAVKGTINEAVRAIDTISSVSGLSQSVREDMAIQDCIELLGYSVDELSWSMAELGKLVSENRDAHYEMNLRSWLSAALSNQDTCLDGFDGEAGPLKHYVRGSLMEVSQLVSNLLAMYNKMRSIIPHTPPANATDIGRSVDLPPWIEVEDGLIHAHPKTFHVDAVVALDGSGRYRSINEAINRAPNHSSKRYVIYVKKGLYRENVELKKKKANLMLIGDGVGNTVISGSRSFKEGWTTFRTATFAVSGKGFIARDITFRNTAGPENHQAVALRVDSDRSAFFRCSMEGYQDTLYIHSLRQFYRDCNIYGTVDFIFGNGLAVLQHCNIYTRKPLPGQQVTVTAQGRKSPDQFTGFSLHNCFFHATFPTYLGRPWKQYSRTVVMQSYVSAAVQSAGWLEWAGDFALSSLWYGEYMNYGPGSSINGRVRWPGYHTIEDPALASLFTVRRFIDGLSWLPATGVTFTADLIK